MLTAAFSISPLQSLAVAGSRRSSFSTRISATTARSSVSSASPSLYEILGLHAGANASDIKAAYRRLARKCHPDTAAAGREGTAADEFMRLHAAYSTLSDPEKRVEYDRRIIVVGSGRRRPQSTASGSFSGYGRRTWETDQCW